MSRPDARHAGTDTAIADAFGLAHQQLAESLRALLEGELDAASLRRLLGDVMRQIKLEEELLYEPFEQGSGLKQQGPTVLLRREHLEIVRRLETLASALEDGLERDALADIRALIALLDDHRRRESAALFPTCDRLLDGEARRAALQALALRSVEPAATTTRMDPAPPGHERAG